MGDGVLRVLSSVGFPPTPNEISYSSPLVHEGQLCRHYISHFSCGSLQLLQFYPWPLLSINSLLTQDWGRIGTYMSVLYSSIKECPHSLSHFPSEICQHNFSSFAFLLSQAGSGRKPANRKWVGENYFPV